MRIQKHNDGLEGVSLITNDRDLKDLLSAAIKHSASEMKLTDDVALVAHHAQKMLYWQEKLNEL